MSLEWIECSISGRIVTLFLRISHEVLINTGNALKAKFSPFTAPERRDEHTFLNTVSTLPQH